MRLAEYLQWVSMADVPRGELEAQLLAEMETALGVASEEQLAGRLGGCLEFIANLYPKMPAWVKAHGMVSDPAYADTSASVSLYRAAYQATDAPEVRLANFMRAVNQFGYSMPEVIEFSRRRLSGEMVGA